ncbi:hypothetical protein HRG84_23810 [Flavisolibacter sp. BT320]|nr:hypothetical protein [Flavisolibacter longurius]
MTTFKTILTAFVLTTCMVVQGQDTSGLKLVSYDTLQLSLTASKVLAYKSGSVIFLMDYRKAKELLASQAKRGLLKELAKQQLDSAEKQITKSDTAYLHDAVFAKWKWGPFDQLLCELLNSKSCIIEDEQGRLYRKVIRMHGYVWPDKYIQWTGWRYFVPGAFKYFYECTQSES